MAEIDGKRIRIVILEAIPVSTVFEEGGSETERLITGPYRILEMRDPGTLEADDKAWWRSQLVATDRGVFERLLPPEQNGDMWPNEASVRPFKFSDWVGSDDVFQLLEKTDWVKLHSD